MSAATLSASVSASSSSPNSLSARQSIPQAFNPGRIAVGYVRVSTAMQSEDGLPPTVDPTPHFDTCIGGGGTDQALTCERAVAI